MSVVGPVRLSEPDRVWLLSGRADELEGRAERLRRVLDLALFKGLKSIPYSMEDHKGTLKVSHLEPLDDFDRDCFRGAWECVHELGENVEFEKLLSGPPRLRSQFKKVAYVEVTDVQDYEKRV